jgi:hypothetical protein
VSWHTAHDPFAEVAAHAGIHVTDTTAGADADGGACPAGDGPATRPRRLVSGLLPLVEVLGIDDHRRGKPLYHRDPASGAWVADADRWQTVFVDSAGGRRPPRERQAERARRRRADRPLGAGLREQRAFRNWLADPQPGGRP